MKNVQLQNDTFTGGRSFDDTGWSDIFSSFQVKAEKILNLLTILPEVAKDSGIITDLIA